MELEIDIYIKLGVSFQPLLNACEEGSLDDCYNKFVDTVNRVTEETVGFRKQKALDGLSNETIALCEKRRGLRKIIISSERSRASNIDEYKEVNRLVKRAVKQTKRRRLERKILKLENDFRKNDSHELFKAVRELEGKPRKSLMAVKNKDGEKKHKN